MPDVTHSFPDPDAQRVVISAGANSLGFQYDPAGITARIDLGGQVTTFTLEHREFAAFGSALEFLLERARNRAYQADAQVP